MEKGKAMTLEEVFADAKELPVTVEVVRKGAGWEVGEQVKIFGFYKENNGLSDIRIYLGTVVGHKNKGLSKNGYSAGGALFSLPETLDEKVERMVRGKFEDPSIARAMAAIVRELLERS